MNYDEKIKQAKESNISIPTEIGGNKNIVGVYKIFAKKNEERICLYIGKSTDIAYRLLGSSNGHIYMYLKNNLTKLVPQLIKQYISNNYEIEVEIIEVDYRDTHFSRAAHRLASVEISEIVKYQEAGQCLYQLPDGIGDREERFWTENYNKRKNWNNDFYFA